MRVLLGLAALALLAACDSFSGPNRSGDEAAPVAAGPDVEAGVSYALAEARAEQVSQINYALDFVVPEDPDAPIEAHEVLTFQLARVAGDLQLDFREAATAVKSVMVNGKAYPVVHAEEHLLLPAAGLKRGANKVRIEFEAGKTSLNRNPDYLYTLFVPDRARTAFPVFDQPNLKATYDLTLDLPASWQALGNAPVEQVDSVAPGAPGSDRRVHRFARTDRISSYLFSFVAGEFQSITRTIDGREMTMLHREPDEEKVARNVDAIFQQHADALTWLEDYTGIAYPFQKFDFVLIPTFQYGGMEHVGAVQYRARALFLDENPSAPQLLNRANLIAHETAHMWFGDLVTMDWFNDVWTKEVFANFMAAKIVNPGFPEIDHDLNFLLRIYPAAYGVDRTAGTNAIRQELPNLNEAGTLYGGIIYNKAPIMMRQLEALIGEDVFRDGMREYQSTYAGRNATWPDLVEILDKRSDADLKAWSDVWVNTAGRPHFVLAEDGKTLQQIDPGNEGRFWPQRFAARFHDPAVRGVAGVSMRTFEFRAGGAPRLLETGEPVIAGVLPEIMDQPVLYNSNGFGYGLFPVDFELAQARWDGFTDLEKGAQLINLYEQMLEGHEVVSPRAYLEFLTSKIASEQNELLLSTMLGQMGRTYWSFISDADRADLIGNIENVLWRGAGARRRPISTRKLFLRGLQDLAASEESLDRLIDIWRGTVRIDGVSLSTRERSNLVALLAIKRPAEAANLLGEHMAWLDNPDERRRFEFIAPALAASEEARDAFFASLAEEENRATESWVVDALGYLHHPERVASSEQYIAGSLALMEEIQTTGDIFFPTRWSVQTLRNHRSPEAAETVRTFLRERPGYNPQLRLKILQAADLLFRSERLLAE